MTAKLKVAIVDYGLGNLFSIKQACHLSGMNADITASSDRITKADAIILPGVGAFGDAMSQLNQLQLVDVLREEVQIGKPMIGICLGLQLLMTSSEEFGAHEGLGFVPGTVVSLTDAVKSDDNLKNLKVPQVGWNRIYGSKADTKNDFWSKSPLQDLDQGDFMYFVHSYYVIPDDNDVVLSKTKYGDIDFCSSIQYQNVFACQFHPERSGERGRTIYNNMKNWIRSIVI